MAQRIAALAATTILALVGSSACATEEPATDPANSTAKYQKALREGIDNLVRDGGFPAAMASVRDSDGKSRFYSAGVADLTTEAPVPKDGQVRIASATKMFTATVVLQLVGEGKIGLDESIEKHLPGLVRGDGIDGRDITVHQLLQHTSGLPEYAQFTEDFLKVQHLYQEPRQLLDMALAQKAQFAPGTDWRYSNTNYVLAGLIVQQVTGRPISEEITNRVIDDIGLRHTYWPGVGEQTIREGHAHGYTPAIEGESRVDIAEMDPSWGWAAGQLVSTTSDLNRFLIALLDGELLEPEQLEAMKSTVDSPGFPPNWRYGLGLMRIELSCGAVWGHGGDIDGYETRDAVTEDGRAATVVVTSLPTPDQAEDNPVDDVLDTAICDS